MASMARLMMIAGMCALPVAAFAQAARDGNIYDGFDHQPTADGVQSREQAAGVAPTRGREDAENRDLDSLNQQLQDKARHDAELHPEAKTNVYGVQPGGIVRITPDATGTSGGGAGAATGH